MIYVARNVLQNTRTMQEQQVDNMAKGRISKQLLQEIKASKIF